MPNKGFNVRGKRSDEWETPPWLFRALDTEFRFDLDPCAMPQNAKCAKFFSPSENGLDQSWDGHTVFVNPPYSNIKPWVNKALCNDGTVVLLLPVRTDNDWFHELRQTHWAQFRFFRNRIRFLEDGKEQKSPRFSSMVVVLR